MALNSLSPRRTSTSSTRGRTSHPCRRELAPALKDSRSPAYEEPTTTTRGTDPSTTCRQAPASSGTGALPDVVGRTNKRPSTIVVSPHPGLSPCFWQRELQLWELGPRNGSRFGHFSRAEAPLRAYCVGGSISCAMRVSF